MMQCFPKCVLQNVRPFMSSFLGEKREREREFQKQRSLGNMAYLSGDSNCTWLDVSL